MDSIKARVATESPTTVDLTDTTDDDDLIPPLQVPCTYRKILRLAGKLSPNPNHAVQESVTDVLPSRQSSSAKPENGNASRDTVPRARARPLASAPKNNLESTVGQPMKSPFIRPPCRKTGVAATTRPPRGATSHGIVVDDAARNAHFLQSNITSVVRHFGRSNTACPPAIYDIYTLKAVLGTGKADNLRFFLGGPN